MKHVVHYDPTDPSLMSVPEELFQEGQPLLLAERPDKCALGHPIEYVPLET